VASSEYVNVFFGEILCDIFRDLLYSLSAALLARSKEHFSEYVDVTVELTPPTVSDNVTFVVSAHASALITSLYAADSLSEISRKGERTRQMTDEGAKEKFTRELSCHRYTSLKHDKTVNMEANNE
jgi:hypothetical protein